LLANYVSATDDVAAPPAHVHDQPPAGDEPLVLIAPFAPPSATPPEKPAVPPTPTPAERWALMKLMQGTWLGVPLDSERMQITGWTDMTYTASSDHTLNGPMGFNYRANDFLLQQNWVRFERSVVTSGTEEPSFGFRSDWILPGSDYKYTLARGIFNEQLIANNGTPQTYGIDPIQFYAEAYFPTVGRGLDLKLGRMFCQYGVESNDAPSNALSSHAYTFIYDPFTQTGVMGTLKLTDAWSVQLGAILGPDVFIDQASSPYSMGSIKWAPPTGRTSVLFSFILGSGRFNQAEDFNNPNIFDLVVTHQLDSRLTYNFESLYGYQTNVPAIGTATWFGILNYLTYTFSPRLNGTARLEFFDDVQGQRTGFRGLYTAATAGLNFHLTREIIFRPELRYDYNGESRPFENHHGLFTATGDVILRW
jgi:hypothetical protein